jgi:hypothetical protein
MNMEKEKERFLRVSDGTIHGWNQWLAMEPNVREVTEEEAYPERFVKGGKRKAAVNLETEEEAGPANEANLADGAQLSNKDAAAADLLAGKSATGKGFNK